MGGDDRIRDGRGYRDEMGGGYRVKMGRNI